MTDHHDGETPGAQWIDGEQWRKAILGPGIRITLMVYDNEPTITGHIASYTYTCDSCGMRHRQYRGLGSAPPRSIQCPACGCHFPDPTRIIPYAHTHTYPAPYAALIAKQAGLL